MDLNDACLENLFPEAPRYDPDREAYVQEVDGKTVELFRLNRADPNKPITVRHLFTGAVFVPGQPDGPWIRRSEGTEKRLSADVEAFYYAASRFWDHLEQKVLDKSKSKFIGVKMVRNKLLEHATKGATNSFGATDIHGPVVKPMRNNCKNDLPYDAGLILNVYELLDKSLARLQG